MNFVLKVGKHDVRLLFTYICLLFLGVLFVVGTNLMELGARINLQVIESQVKLEEVADRMAWDLDQRCKGSHQLLEAKIRWFVARRSGWPEVDRMDAGVDGGS